MAIQRLRAVALVVSNPAGEILVLQEFNSKPHLGKYFGMFSIPMETIHPGEDCFAALERLRDEELPGFPPLPLPGKRIGVYRVARQAWAELHALSVNTNCLPDTAGRQLDVGNHRWVSQQEACGLWLRRGALEMIQDYAAKKRDVRRMHCSEPSLVQT